MIAPSSMMLTQDEASWDTMSGSWEIDHFSVYSMITWSLPTSDVGLMFGMRPRMPNDLANWGNLATNFVWYLSPWKWSTVMGASPGDLIVFNGGNAGWDLVNELARIHHDAAARTAFFQRHWVADVDDALGRHLTVVHLL